MIFSGGLDIFSGFNLFNLLTSVGGLVGLMECSCEVSRK